jgi:hypothetical protein
MEIKAITILLTLKTIRTKLGKPEGNNIKAVKQDSFQFEIYQTLVKGRDIEYGCAKFFFLEGQVVLLRLEQLAPFIRPENRWKVALSHSHQSRRVRTVDDECDYVTRSRAVREERK